MTDQPAEFDTFHKRNVICPHCGSEHSDSWEINFGSSELKEMDCWSCGKPFLAIRDIYVDYSSRKIDPK